jgi:hypothetical protein
MKETETKLKLEIKKQTKKAINENFIQLKEGGIEDLNGILIYLMEEAMSSPGGIERSELRDNLIKLGKIAELIDW